MPIFDQGYQHWNGQLSGHAWRWFAIARHGVRIGMQAKSFRLLLLGSLLPALTLALAFTIWGLIERKATMIGFIVQFLITSGILNPVVVADPRHYRVEIWTLCYTFFFACQLTLSMLLILGVGPDLISQDLRFNALPLYLSRPLRRVDYILGKLGVVAAFLGLVILVPCVLAYVLGLLFSLDLTIVRDTYGVLLASLAYGLIIIVSAGFLILALSSLSRNSRYVALMWLGVWIVTNVVSSVLETTNQVQRSRAAYQRMTQQQPDPPQPRNARERRRPGRAFGPGRPRAGYDPFSAEELEAARKDWRPLVSYTGNLARVGRQLLGTDAALKSLSELELAQRGPGMLRRFSGPQYPWIWSAGVLAGLFGLSIWILSLSVRSLDRLR